MADEHERRKVADERERRDEPVEGALRGGDPEFHLHSELGEEAKRLATHPRAEAHRLSEELKAGEVETTPLIALSGIGIWRTGLQGAARNRERPRQAGLLAGYASSMIVDG